MRESCILRLLGAESGHHPIYVTEVEAVTEKARINLDSKIRSDMNNTEFPIPSCERFCHVLFWDMRLDECLLIFGSESVFGLAPKLSLAQLPKT